MKLSDLDALIVANLQEDARLSFRELATRLGVTTPTVSARVKDLEALGILRGYHARVDPAFLGGALHVLTLRARPAAVADVARALARAPGVEEVLVLAGGVVHARARLRPPESTLARLHAAVAALPDVVAYDAAEVIDVAHAEPQQLAPEGTLDVPCHECKGPIHGEGVRLRLGERAHVFCCRTCAADFRARFEKLARKR